jgi:hypothetical protein
MGNTWIRRLSMAALVVVLGGLATTPRSVLAADDEKPKTTYTRVEMWQVERARWSDFVEMFEKYDAPILERLMAEGAISEWGIDAAALHHPEGYTHSTWYSADSMGALAKAGEAYIAAWEAMGKESMKELDTEFASMITKHRDYVIETDDMRSVAGTFDGGYYHAALVKVTRGKDRGYHSFWDNRLKPVYQKLFDEGILIAYGLSTEEITTEDPMLHSSWYIVKDADGLDAVEAAFDAWWEAEDEEGRRARWTSIMDVVEEGSYREDMTSIIKMSISAR